MTSEEERALKAGEALAQRRNGGIITNDLMIEFDAAYDALAASRKKWRYMPWDSAGWGAGRLEGPNNTTIFVCRTDGAADKSRALAIMDLLNAADKP